MHFNQYFLSIFAYLTFFNLVLPEISKANIKENYKQRSGCSYENAQFEKTTKESKFDWNNNGKLIPDYKTRRYCITGDKRVVSYLKLEQNKSSSPYVNRGFLGKEESYFTTIGVALSTWAIDQWSIEDDQLILYSCYSSSAYKCTGTINRTVMGYRIGSLINKNNLENSLRNADGGKYIGDYKDGKFHGRGTYIWKDGDKYIGDWLDGKRTGKGTYIWKNGDKYIGDWLDGKRTGKGTYIWENGGKYIGDWVDGKRTGKGTHAWNNGDKYIGDWLDGKRTGKGTFEWNNGKKYVGDFVNNEITGYGELIDPNGKVIQGKWLNGQQL